jgi:hypothetical protein
MRGTLSSTRNAARLAASDGAMRLTPALAAPQGTTLAVRHLRVGGAPNEATLGARADLRKPASGSGSPLT